MVGSVHPNTTVNLDRWVQTLTLPTCSFRRNPDSSDQAVFSSLLLSIVGESVSTAASDLCS